MISIEETKDPVIIKHIVTNPKLYAVAGYITPIKDFRPNLNELWLKVVMDRKPIGLFEFKEFTHITLESHIYILPEYQKGSIAVDSVNKCKEWLNKNTTYWKSLVQAPISCLHVLKFLRKAGFTVCGQIKHGIDYKNCVQDLILFELDLR